MSKIYGWVVCVMLLLVVAAFPIGMTHAGESNDFAVSQERVDVAAADYAGIARAVEFYFEAGRKGDSEYAKKVFLPEANIYFTREGKVAGGPIQILYDMVEGKPSPTEIIYKIAAVDVAGNIAMIRLEIADWAGNTYTDMFTMIKDGEDWKIASKVSRRP